MVDSRDEEYKTAPARDSGRFAVAALVISIMAVIFSLAIGPRLRGTEREQAEIRRELEGVRREIAALRR
ncbi:MAG TPA: hypothetical protein PLU39_16680, partial [Armatimonadota bacterium]|nr:hypothetical protein [Armatimonadota bacterium]